MSFLNFTLISSIYFECKFMFLQPVDNTFWYTFLTRPNPFILDEFCKCVVNWSNPVMIIISNQGGKMEFTSSFRSHFFPFSIEKVFNSLLNSSIYLASSSSSNLVLLLIKLQIWDSTSYIILSTIWFIGLTYLFNSSNSSALSLSLSFKFLEIKLVWDFFLKYSMYLW